MKFESLACEIERDRPLTAFEKVAGFVAIVAPLIGLLASGVVASMFAGGCANTPSGVKVVASSASYTNIGDINWDEYKIPVLSVYLGPKATVWINKSYTALDEIAICGTVTNSTAALAIYDSREEKTLTMRMRFREAATNRLTNATDTITPIVADAP